MATTSRVVVLAVLFGVAACADVPEDPDERAEFERVNDPAEPTNRAIFDANQFVDRNVLKPVAEAYDENMPDEAKHSVQSFVTNLSEPGVLVNDVLQGNLDRAWNTTQRFVVNSTVGGAGLFDVASDWGLPAHQADFGQTFGVWGMGPGPAVQLPLLGPSNARDAVGTVVGFVANPLNFIPGSTMSTIVISGTGTGLVDSRARMLPITNDLEANSLDYYAALRSAAAQRRETLVEEGKAGEVDPANGTVTIDPAQIQVAP